MADGSSAFVWTIVRGNPLHLQGDTPVKWPKRLEQVFGWKDDDTAPILRVAVAAGEICPLQPVKQGGNRSCRQPQFRSDRAWLSRCLGEHIKAAQVVAADTRSQGRQRIKPIDRRVKTPTCGHEFFRTGLHG